MLNPGSYALWLEFLLLFGGVPVLILQFRDRWLMVGLLWAGAAGAFLYKRRFRHDEPRRDGTVRDNIKHVLLRFALIAPIMTAVTLITIPGSFFSFPRERPGLWVLVLVLYPLLSVWPQEMIYRAFVYRRYEPLFGLRAGYVLASALAFGFMHIIFVNTVAIVLSVLGGLLFAGNYARHRSLALVSIEHALYGCLIFTIGLGKFFFAGYAWS
ncbi:MAG TPA: CPBP family intramembrane glutamic endopeptidase [Thermodesulfobacteriota bacterium]|nr:CPBP family intramembrane glutamic endopeptidase [Thermodesulfobacteriota bacterium]